jgi:Ser/Thr protein kinase RdoA (MazF antagonist)
VTTLPRTAHEVLRLLFTAAPRAFGVDVKDAERALHGRDGRRVLVFSERGEPIPAKPAALASTGRWQSWMAEPEQLERWAGARGPGARGLSLEASSTLVRQLGRDAIEALARGDVRGEVLKENPRRRVMRVDTPAGAGVVKHYASDRGLERLKVLAFGNRARREWETALALRVAGLPVPQPWFLAVGPVGAAAARGGGPDEIGLADFASSFGAAAIPNARPLGGHLEDLAASRAASPSAALDALAPTLGVLARMHAAGFHHRDFHGGNVLLRGGEPRDVVVIDLHRVDRGREVGVAARAEALATLLHTLRFGLAQDQFAAAIDLYADAANLSAARPRFVTTVLARIAQREAARVESRSKRCVRESSEFTAVHAGGCRGWRRRNVDEGVLFAAIARAREALAAGSPHVRSIARRSSVALAAAGDASWAVKVYDGDGRRKSLRARWTEGRAGAAYRAGFALAVRAVPAPPVVAWVKTPDRSVLVMTAYDDAVTLLQASFRWLAEPRERRDALLRAGADAVAELLRSLWTARVQVHDLSPKNVLLRARDGVVRASLCDFDGIRFGRAPTLERLIRGLAQVNDCAPGIPARARLRVLCQLKRSLPLLRRTGVAAAIWRTTRDRAEKTLP